MTLKEDEKLAAHPEVEPQCKPIIGIFIASDREENIGEIRRNVAKTLHTSVDNIGILQRWENIRNKPCNEENYRQIMNEYSYRWLLSHYLDYFASMKLQGDLSMLKAIVESGLAEEWKVEDKVKSAIKAIEGR